MLNTGIIARREEPTEADRDAPRTLIVTGIARSGTSMVAGILKDAGVFMGDVLHDVVDEDAAVLQVLQSRDLPALKRLVAARDAAWPVWGFKVPNLHAFLRAEEVGLFRNPRLIVVYRDPVAVAVRNALSEHYGEMQALVAATNAAFTLARFVERAGVPVLLLSYEKALSFPHLTIDHLLSFCGVAVDHATRNRLFLRVQPNREEYLDRARRTYAGAIDGVFDQELRGWCVEDGRLQPVELELWADGVMLDRFVADRPREDLPRLGFGNGNHGFSCDLRRFGLSPAAVISVRIARRVLTLNHSGTALGELPVLSAA